MIKLIVKLLFSLGYIFSAAGIIRIGYFEAKAALAQHLMLSAWKDTVEKGRQLKKGTIRTNVSIKPWPWADTWPVLKMKIPSIKSVALILKDASGESLAFGPGLLTGNIMPGDLGNSFIAAHRDTHFKHLDRLEKGALIIIEDRFKKIQQFKVDQIKIVDSRVEQPFVNTSEIRVTLVTCYPLDAVEANTPFRYLVSATKII